MSWKEYIQRGIKHFALNTKQINTNLIQSRSKSTCYISFNPFFKCTLVIYKVFDVVIEFDGYVQLEEGRITHWTSSFPNLPFLKTEYILKKMEFNKKVC